MDSEATNVEIVRVDLYDQTNHLYGADYYARNQSSYPIYVAIGLSAGENVTDGLVDGYVYVEPWGDVYMGYVVQDNTYQPFSWSYQWQAYPATQQTGVYYYY